MDSTPIPSTSEETQWTCDTCGKLIVAAKDGWVEWLSSGPIGERRMSGMRLVHHFPASSMRGPTRCQYDESNMHDAHICDTGLDELLGPDGLMELLSMLADSAYDKAEVFEIIRRLHIPGYEQARNHFDRALAEGIFEPNTPPPFYTQGDIRRVLNWLSKGEE